MSISQDALEKAFATRNCGYLDRSTQTVKMFQSVRECGDPNECACLQEHRDALIAEDKH